MNAGQERPFVSQLFGPQPTFVSDYTEETAGFLEAAVTPVSNLVFVAGGRFDSFNQFGDIWTYRFAGSYLVGPTNTRLHASVATGFSPPSSQDKIFGNNFGLKPEKDLGWDAGFEQRFWQDRVTVGATYFHNDLSNLIGFNGLFETLNLGAARTQGIEARTAGSPAPGAALDRELHLSRGGEHFERGHQPAARGAFAPAAAQRGLCIGFLSVGPKITHPDRGQICQCA